MQENQNLIICDIDWTEIFDIVPYYISLKKTYKANYQTIRDLKKFAIKKGISLKKKDDGTLDLNKERLQIVSKEPIDLRHWEKLRLDLNEFLSHHNLPLDMFRI